MRGVKIKNCDYETLTSDTGELKQEQWSKIVRKGMILNEEKVFFRHESNDRV